MLCDAIAEQYEADAETLQALVTDARKLFARVSRVTFTDLSAAEAHLIDAIAELNCAAEAANETADEAWRDIGGDRSPAAFDRGH